MPTPFIPGRTLLVLALVVGLVPRLPGAQDAALSPSLRRDHYRSGEATLSAFAPVSEATRNSIVKLNVNGTTVALATVVDTNGLALTKASELKKGKLTGWLANEKEVDAELISTDDEEDLALVRVHAVGLKPIRWAADEVTIGQWAITPGIAATPQAVGIISALPHRVRPPRALIGVQFDYFGPKPKIKDVLPGLGAEKVGLKSGDVILAVNAQTVTNREQVIETLREFREGQHVKLRIQRSETQFTVEVRMMVPRAGQLEVDLDDQQRLGRLDGAVSQRSQGFEQAIEHDTVLQPWLCGGPLVDLDGKAIGINIARASRVSTYALPSRLVKQVLDNLKTKAKTTVPADKSDSLHRP
jgi:serine protease Do